MTKDKRFNWRFCLCCGIFVWFVINLLQGIFTEIHEDEAYYALFGEHLAWGYFDHPPMVGLMTFLSSIFFSGTLGVRFFTIIASCLSLWVMWEIATYYSSIDSSQRTNQRRNDMGEANSQLSTLNSQVFLIIAFSIVMFNIYGFVTTPDASLILFSALFLLVYQRYLVDKSWKNALLMGLTMALMVYSKYHAFLFLGLIVLSNLKLLKDGKFWTACLLALALLMPHILWQVNNDFPSFKYHLVGRNEAFRWSYFLEYLPNQLLIFNPFTFGAVVYVLIKRNMPNAPQDKTSLQPIDSHHRTSPRWNDMYSKLVFERGLKFILIGFFFFFWLMAFRGHVEPHWTIVCVIPMVVLVYRKALVDAKLRKYIQRFVLPSLALVLAFRIILLTPLASRFGFSDKEDYYKAIGTAAGDCPVVFLGSFQRPALYHYFTGKESSTLKCFYDRKTQFDLWQFDKAWIGKEVFVFGSVKGRSKEYQINGASFPGYRMQHFRSPNRLVISFKITNADPNEPFVFHRGEIIHADFSVYNPCDAPIVFRNEDYNLFFNAHYLPGDEVTYCFSDRFAEIPPHSSVEGHLFTTVGEHISLGKHRFNLGVTDPIASFVTEESGVEIRIEP
ncbi:MAG: glycosyltransferase family 39 protein [Bacteroidales bacterium]|nr:glycosyltransferase family 39 protein [Bacteroidales bacterium]